jgi:hypothetical protein
MRVVMRDGGQTSETIMDFVVADLATARRLIAEGAINGAELLTESGMTEAEAEAELAKLDHLPQEVIDRMAYDDQPAIDPDDPLTRL